MHLQLAPERADEFAERLLVADPGPVNQVPAHRTTLPQPCALDSAQLLPVVTRPCRKLGGPGSRQLRPLPGVYTTEPIREDANDRQ